jgi:hypothetical protein
MDASGLLWILYDTILYDTILNDTAVAESRSHARSGAHLRILAHGAEAATKPWQGRAMMGGDREERSVIAAQCRDATSMRYI